MKKLLALCLTVVLCLCCLASCGSAHKENEWFSEEKLTNCLVGDLPTITKDYVNHDDGDIYVSSSYKFVYSDGTLDEDGDLIFCIISIYDYETKTLEYGTKNFSYNTLITLDYKSEAPLSGFYVLNEE